MSGKGREWIKKITKWLFESPADNNKKNTSQKNDVITEKTTELPPKENLAQEKAEKKTLTPLAKACEIFLDAWQKEGLPRDLFLEEEQLEGTLKSLDKDFREELIEWLYQVCKEPLVLKDLESIIKRGRVTGTENLKAIRAFSYISIFVNSKKIKFEGVEQVKEVNKPIEIIEKKPPTQYEDWGIDLTDELEIPLSDLELSIRTYNNLRKNGINNVIDLAGMKENDFLSLTNFGRKSLEELKFKLEFKDIKFPIETSFLSKTKAKKEQKIDLSINEQKEEGKSDQEYWVELKAMVETMNNKNISFENIFKEFISCSRVLGLGNNINLLASSFCNIFIDIDVLISTQSSKEKNQLNEYFQYLKPILFNKMMSYDYYNANLWKNKFNKILSNKGKPIIFYLLRCSNKTLQDIANQYGISREGVRKNISKFEKVIGIKSIQLVEDFNKIRADNERLIFQAAVESWIERLGRLPIKTDEKPTEKDHIQLWDETIKKSPLDRIKTYETFSITVPKEEFDYHYDVFCYSSQSAGNGYWQKFDNLKEFVLRHAVKLGAPELMPKQTSFPRRMGGVVTRHGGQSKVAKKLGLIYQGQLVSDSGGRRYWTDEKLQELISDTNSFHEQDVDLMPNYGQILEFFEAQTEEKYRNKKPNSAIAALTNMGNLHWMEVAKRFDKKFQTGVSQKAVSVGLIKAFVRDLGDHLGALSPSELYVLFQAQGISRKEQEKFSRTFDVLIDAVQSGMVDKKDLEDWSNNVEVPSIKDLLDLGGEIKKESTKEEKESLLLERRSKALQDEFRYEESFKLDEVTKDDLPNLDPLKTLRALDKAAGVIENSGTDIDHVEFLKAKATAKLWDACFADETTLINGLRAGQLEKDTYSEEVRNSFLEEFEGARNLQIPPSYQFRDLRGCPRDPKLMQRLVAFRLQRDKRLLNLSGTGTGKTLSAIFSAQVCSCKRIFITCPNGVIGSWERTFNSAYPDAVIHKRPDQWLLPELDQRTHVVIVNHERFQDRFAESLLSFCVNFRTDFLVIDEIHQSKRRTSSTSSQRRRLLSEFIRISSNINPDLHVLGLSATPVINNLYEGKSLIELITQQQIEDVTEDFDLNCCMNLYQQFVINGIRMNPGQLPRTDIVLKEVNATKLLPEIIYATRNRTYHEVERLLVKPKIEVLGECLERGSKTVIFITLIQNTLKPICNWLQKEKYSFSVFTGDEKEASEAGFKDSLDEFIHGKTEVLVASVQCAGTGVDGLQSVCNRAIFFQLPWTSTEFEQTIGRLDRDGTEFESVKVFLPITNIHLPNGDQWSWCQSKLDRIRSKKDIAKAAVDGEMPDATSMITPQEASKYWLKWLRRLEEKSHSS